jgi:hypothetical protein
MLRTVRETVVRAGQSGNAAYLAAIVETVKEEAKLRGLYPDPKLSVSSTGKTEDGQRVMTWEDFLAAFDPSAPDRAFDVEREIETLSGRVGPRKALPESAETRR